MKTSDNNFELILQEVLKQKQLLESLQSENVELNRQLSDLREGRGIFVEILGQRFPPLGEPVGFSPHAVSTANEDLSLQATAEIQSETPATASELTVEEIPDDLPAYVAPTMPSYLEEAMLDEFAAAATREMEQVAVWPGPITNPPGFDEKEKETLRRELSGSFLLE